MMIWTKRRVLGGNISKAACSPILLCNLIRSQAKYTISQLPATVILLPAPSKNDT